MCLYMILDTIEELNNYLQVGWSEMLNKDDRFNAKLSSLLKAKEPGHSLASSVEEKIIEILKSKFVTRVESNRDIADVWINIDGSFIPFNIKTHIKRFSKGGAKKNGQPNICSMKRIIEGVTNERFNYYFIIWVIIDQQTESCEIVIDSLSDLFVRNALTFNDGPGQIMAKQKYCAKGIENNLTLSEILLELNDFRLLTIKKNREHRDEVSNKLTSSVKTFLEMKRTPV